MNPVFLLFKEQVELVEIPLHTYTCLFIAAATSKHAPACHFQYTQILLDLWLFMKLLWPLSVESTTLFFKFNHTSQVLWLCNSSNNTNEKAGIVSSAVPGFSVLAEMNFPGNNNNKKLNVLLYTQKSVSFGGSAFQLKWTNCSTKKHNILHNVN